MDLCWQSNVFAFNMMSRLVITFLPRSKHLLISWLQLWKRSPLSWGTYNAKMVWGMSTNNNTCHNQRVAKDPVMVPINFLLGSTKHFGKKKGENGLFRGCCCCSVTQSCLILCDPMDCSTRGLPVPKLPKFAQTQTQFASSVLSCILKF